MANKKYKLSDGNSWATDGIFDFGQNKTQRQINSDLNGAITSIEPSLAIVSTGNTHVYISKGQYVYVKGHSTLATGLYKANSNIQANDTLTLSNLTAITDGGFNEIPKVGASLLTTKNSAVVATGANTPELYCQTYGRILLLSGVLTLLGETAGSNAVLATLNSAITPPTNEIGFYAFGNYGGGGYNFFQMKLKPNGDIITSTGGSTFTGQIKFPAVPIFLS